MDDLLKPIHTRTANSDSSNAGHLVPAASATPTGERKTSVASVDEALQVLRADPSLQELKVALDFVDPKNAAKSGFNIRRPSSQAAQLVHVLVESTLPSFWPVVKGEHGRGGADEHSRERAALLRCLATLAGLGAIVARLRALLASGKEERGAPETRPSLRPISDLSDVLCTLLKGDAFIWHVWQGLHDLSGSVTQSNMLWRELVALLCMGKLLSVTAEAVLFVRESSKDVPAGIWIGDGQKYSVWLGRNIAYMSLRLTPAERDAWDALAQVLGKSFALGYPDRVVEEIVQAMLRQEGQETTALGLLLDRLSRSERRRFLLSVLRLLPQRFLMSTGAVSGDASWWTADAKNVSGAAALLRLIVEHREDLLAELDGWLIGPSSGGVGDGVAVKRAAIVALSEDEGRLRTVVEKSLQQFGDKLYIKHTPILQQEAGCLHRASPGAFEAIGRSSTHLHAVSNRLAASSVRSRVLGMIAGTAVSELIDKPDSRMAFSMDEMKTTEAQWYLSLTRVVDRVGSLSDLRAATTTTVPRPVKRIEPRKATTQSKVVVVDEVVDSDEGSEEFLPYEKPDSDEEDEEEDATLVSRDKATAPVYIRDLIAGLRDKDNYDRHRLALSTAAALIRRKAGFGSEVAAHAEELAGLLTILDDKYDIERFQEQRVQAMIALLVAQPAVMGPWLARAFFEGDYSAGQRAAVLNTLGMGARELAGFGEEDGGLTGATTLLAGPAGAFPSKKLPARMHAVYAGGAVDGLAARLEKSMLTPMAREAADKLSGPSALKVRTFSSRMAIEAARPAPKANALSAVVAPAFFFPLTGRWHAHVRTAQGTGQTAQGTPYLQSLYVKTLAIILHAAGASAPALPQMATELWDLVLSLRVGADDASVREALLFALLTLLDAHADSPAAQRRLVVEHPRQLLETRDWAEAVFDAASSSSSIAGAAASSAGMAALAGIAASKRTDASSEDDRVRTLAAALLVRVRDVVERWHVLLAGDMAAF